MRQMRVRIHHDTATHRNPNDYNEFRGLKKDLQKLLSRQLSYDPFHLLVKKGSQNVRRVQAASLHDVIKLYWLVSGEYFLKLLFG
jgi:hypothetical protein